MHSRAETRISDVSCADSLLIHPPHLEALAVAGETCCGCSTRHQSHEDLLVWPSSETRPDSCDYGDTASVGEFPDPHIQVNDTQPISLIYNSLQWLKWRMIKP